MNIWWIYFWPPISAGLLCGVIAGIVAFRAPRVRVKAAQAEIDAALAQWKIRRIRALVAGAAAAILFAALWHGPFGAADRFSADVERTAGLVLAAYDAPPGMNARIHHGPLTRQLILSGPGDDFQRDEAAKILSRISGVGDASWTRSLGIPLIVEGAIAAVLGFILGLVLAYVVELRRRHNAQWNW
ncbi:MAG: hypothetical protein QOF34_1298 [Sphingomonadales bacterium]|nr:hypothetical protein [Sphingomonadales bacterium]